MIDSSTDVKVVMSLYEYRTAIIDDHDFDDRDKALAALFEAIDEFALNAVETYRDNN